MDIARVVGADTRNDGYCSGNGYMVTWALGHLVSLAMPDTYGYTKTAAEDLPRVFDMGYTGQNGRLDRRSSGIGLYLCRRICRNLRHEIRIEPVPGVGTTVRLTLGRPAFVAE